MKHLIILAALVMGGCTSQPYVNPYLDGRYSSGSDASTSASFKAGLRDGCESGRAIGGGIATYRKEANGTADYNEGWNFGKEQCLEQYRNIDRALRQSGW